MPVTGYPIAFSLSTCALHFCENGRQRGEEGERGLAHLRVEFFAHEAGPALRQVKRPQRVGQIGRVDY